MKKLLVLGLSLDPMILEGKRAVRDTRVMAFRGSDLGDDNEPMTPSIEGDDEEGDVPGVGDQDDNDASDEAEGKCAKSCIVWTLMCAQPAEQRAALPGVEAGRPKARTSRSLQDTDCLANPRCGASRLSGEC